MEPEGNVENVTATDAAATARAEGLAEGQRVVELCLQSDQPDRASAFIAEVAAGRKSLADVRAELLRDCDAGLTQ